MMRDETTYLFTLLTHTADGAFLVGENQRILFWNAAAQELLGYTATEVLGRPCCEVLCGHEDQGFPFCRLQCPVVTHIKTDHTVPNFDLWVRTRSGTRQWVNLSILTLPQEQASPLIVHLVRDASQKKRHEEVIDHVSAAIATLQGPKVAPELWQDLSPPDNIELSDREREVLALLAQGLSTNAIAQSLTISPTTVRNHIQNILSKLHVHSQLQAVLYALQHHLIEADQG
jgi:PAS domain S-box-containing protein